MDTRINPEKFEDILALALQHANWISRIGVDRDGGGKVSTPLLIPLTIIPHEDFFVEIEKKWLYVRKNYNNDVVVTYEGQQRSFKMYNLLWARMCVTAYFFYHDDPFWKNTALREMRELNNIPIIQQDVDTAFQKIDAYYEKIARYKLTNQLSSDKQAEPSVPVDTQSSARVAELEQQLAQKDAEIEKLNARIAELEDVNFFRFTFIRSYDKMPNKIKWAMHDLEEAKDSATKTAACLKNLQKNDMLNDQERIGPLKRVKAMFEEMDKYYHLKWDYPALNKALNHPSKKKDTQNG